ncbi:MAG: alkaline phosphatase family protein [Candidatus Cybelea sp.]
MRKPAKTLLIIFCAAVCAAAATAAERLYDSVLPNGWIIERPQGLVIQTGTLPQGAAVSPDGAMLAIVESGYNSPALGLYRTQDLARIAEIPLKGAYGRPLWIDGSHVLVAGANADALFDVDVVAKSPRAIALGKGSYPVAVARSGETFAAATDGDSSVRIGTLDGLSSAKAIGVGGFIGGLAFSADGKALFASNCAARYVEAIDTQTLEERRIETGLHPTAILPVDDTIYVAETDNDTVGVYDASKGTRIASIFVGDRAARGSAIVGVSPNALVRERDAIYVSLGAANDIAVIRDRSVVARIPAGWYPTDVAVLGQRLYIIDGKGERTRPNPRYASGSHSDVDYVAAIQYGSIRAYDLSHVADSGNPQGAAGWTDAQRSAVVRTGGPIAHVFFILKENRSYDQVLGDMPQGNGDPKLTSFGARVTPNEHALATRFGLFDNTYTSGEVSEPGHNWADAAFDTDFVERMWPATYAGRRGDDSLSLAMVPFNGYIWQDAQSARVSFRDYGEMVDPPVPSLAGRYDPRYVGWNLDYSDLNRVKEWRREFADFIHNGNMPRLEYIWLPNDHTYGRRPGKLTPASMVAQNDYALGEIVDTISHSPVWRSSAIFVIEDDAQDGPDHVSAQRTIFFLVSPYARGGLQHAHYSTVSVLSTTELMLGLPPLSTYDGMAVSLRAAFSPVARLAPYTAIAPRVSLYNRNLKTAYNARLTAKLDFSRPDANPPGNQR